MDYNLSGLSWRTFEQLIQAIAVKAIGPSVCVFGDGPDGGREATYDGLIGYSGKKKDWDGYLVMQAKFLQCPLQNSKDADWLVKQLKGDLEKFLNPDKELKSPKYYILVTNVKLSGAAKNGGKVKINKVFSDYKKKLKLLDWDIWDYDKLRCFLDDYDRIAQGYAAWITPGDVLATIIRNLNGNTPDFEETMASFLQKELRKDANARLEQAGTATETNTPLAKVFVDLPFSPERVNAPPYEERDEKSGRLPPGIVNRMLDNGDQKLDPETMSYGREIPSGSDSPFLLNKIVLVGGPGQGKTTIGQFIAQCYRAEILKLRPPLTLEPDATNALNDIKLQCETEGINPPKGRRFPLRIDLNDLATKLVQKEGPNSLLGYLIEKIEKGTDRSISNDLMREWLRDYPWLIVFDGLDEVPESSNRTQLLEAVHDFWIDARALNADVFAIATTRPQGYNDDFSPEQYLHLHLSPLSITRALHYASRLVCTRHGTDSEKCERINNKLQKAAKETTSARLMTSPLQVTIMATLVEIKGDPPPDRWNLFDRYYGVIYDREANRSIPAASLLKDHKPDVDFIHHWAGLALQVKSEVAGGTDARLKTNQLTKIINARLHEEGHSGQGLETLIGRIIDATASRLVFLVGLEAGVAGFEIRSLQEFMASEALMEGKDEDVIKRLHYVGKLSNWRNVFLFAAGRCFAKKQHLRDTVTEVCRQLNQEPSNAEGVVLAGSMLALELLEDGAAANQPNYCLSLAEVALKLLDAPPGEQCKRLAAVFTKTLEASYKKELSGRLENGGESQLGAWALTFSLCDIGHVFAQDLVDKYWPDIDSDSFDMLVLMAGGVNSTSAETGIWQSRFVAALPYVPAHKVIATRKNENLQVRKIRSPIPIVNMLLQGTPHHLHQNGVDIHINKDDETCLSVTYHSLDDGEPATSAHNMLPPDCHDTWLRLEKIHSFTSNPSQDALYKAIQTYNYLDSETKLALSKFSLPWPLAVPIMMASNSSNPEELLTAISAGELGDVDAWRTAEARWSNDGITPEDIEASVDFEYPVNPEIAFRGISPFYGTTIYGGRSAHNVCLGLVPSVSKLKQGELRQCMVDLMMFAHLNFQDDDEARMVCESVLDVAISTDGNTESCSSLVIFAAQNETFFKTIASRVNHLISKAKNFSRYISASLEVQRAQDVISNAVTADPSLTGLLKFSAALALDDTAPKIPADLIRIELFDDEEVKRAAVILNITQDCWGSYSAAVLAEIICNLQRSDPGFVLVTFELIEKLRLEGEHIGKLVLALLEKVENSAVNERKAGTSIIIRLLAKKPSDLQDCVTWNKNALPQVLWEAAFDGADVSI